MHQWTPLHVLLHITLQTSLQALLHMPLCELLYGLLNAALQGWVGLHRNKRLQYSDIRLLCPMFDGPLGK